MQIRIGTLSCTVKSQYKQLFRQRQNVAYIEILLISRLLEDDMRIGKKAQEKSAEGHRTFIKPLKHTSIQK